MTNEAKTVTVVEFNFTRYKMTLLMLYKFLYYSILLYLVAKLEF